MGRVNISKLDMSNKLTTIADMLVIINETRDYEMRKACMNSFIKQIRAEAVEIMKPYKKPTL